MLQVELHWRKWGEEGSAGNMSDRLLFRTSEVRIENGHPNVCVYTFAGSGVDKKLSIFFVFSIDTNI